MPYKDPVKNRAYSAAYNILHKEEICIRRRASRLAHPERKRPYSAAEYRANPRKQVSNAAWRAANPEKARASTRAWAKAHPEAINAKAQRRRALKAGAPVNDFSLAQWSEMKERYGYRCVYCGRKMQRLTQDHLTPLAQGGSHTASNIVPACQLCNSKKGTGTVLVPVQPLLFTLAPKKGA